MFCMGGSRRTTAQAERRPRRAEIAAKGGPRFKPCPITSCISGPYRMGSKPSREDKAMSPLSSWGGSFDDLLCGEGKVCGDQWTPLPSREGSFELNDLERRRSGATLREAYRKDYDDDFEVIRQQPLPMDVFSMRAPADVDRYTMPKQIGRRQSVYENNRTPVIGGRAKRKRKKKRVIRSVKKKNSQRGRRSTTRLSGPPSSVRLHRKTNPLLLRSMSESRVTPAPVYERSTQVKRTAVRS
uniref:Serine/arginine repetitive matrix protein 2 n=2 Tax=Haemonchus contortus TaxID=6289 RepID=A0A7I4XYU9_HAECO